MLATRRSLVDQLANWNDRKHWQEFFDTYWKLIYSAARKAGLTDAEAQEVVQETIITVAKKIEQLQYDPAIGSFKGWLLQHHALAHCRSIPETETGRSATAHALIANARTATIERVADPNAVELDEIWEEEWQQNLLQAAMTRVKKTIDPKQYPDFRLLRFQGMAGAKSRRRNCASVSPGLSGETSRRRLLKKEIMALEKNP